MWRHHEDLHRQRLDYLKAFRIPDDYRARITEAQKKVHAVYDVEKQKTALESRLKKIQELYEWGHKTKSEYLADYAVIKRELVQLPDPCTIDSQTLEKLALFLKDITVAWEKANPEHRNQLASCLFEAVWIKDKRVVAVTTQPDFKPFFDLVYEGKGEGVLQWRPRWASAP